MTKTKWTLILLGVMDLMLIIMHFTDYYILFLKPTGYLIPLGINIVVLSVIGFCSSRYFKILAIIGSILSIPIIMVHGFFVWLTDNSYTKIDSPIGTYSLVIEYRHFAKGEITYSYNFYKTRSGFIGKNLTDQSIRLVIRGTEHPAKLDAEGALGLGNETWTSENIVRFSTWKGMKDVHLNPFQSSVTTVNIEDFIDKVESKENGHTIMVNENRLETRYDEATGQSWIAVSDENGGVIPTQQCSRIVWDEERGYYLLEECTYRWEYPLYPLMYHE